MRLGVVSYNIHANFTNYGSALQSWALHQAIKKCGYTPVLIDYCPDCLKGKNPLNPVSNMWDSDIEARRQCELSLPAIRVNAGKFDNFYTKQFERTARVYTSSNFNEVVGDEKIDAFVCGSDTIFCPDEFGIDDGYWANYQCMQHNSIAYAPSFGDPHFTAKGLKLVAQRVKNFKAVAPRENLLLEYLAANTDAPVKRVIDPTLLFDSEDYDAITADVQEQGDYLVLYSRRYNFAMQDYAEKLAAFMGWRVVEISLRAENAARHRMFYEAGVEEFLSLIKNAKFIVTNSYHGMIFAYQFKTPFYMFSRELCGNKISELLKVMDFSKRLVVEAPPISGREGLLDWDAAGNSLSALRTESWDFLKEELALLKAE